VFFLILACVLGCLCMNLAFLVMLIHVCKNQRSRDVVIVRLRPFVWGLLHQCRDLHRSTYLKLMEDQKPTSHQVVSDFRLPVRYYLVIYS
jgi:hypothetical protein